MLAIVGQTKFLSVSLVHDTALLLPPFSISAFVTKYIVWYLVISVDMSPLSSLGRPVGTRVIKLLVWNTR